MDGYGSVIAINRYDEYGIPASTNQGRFQYTGLPWLPQLGMQNSRNRIYSTTLGRFMQTDPIGTAGGINLYGYVSNDPVNSSDPTGLFESWTGTRIARQDVGPGLCGSCSGFSTGSITGQIDRGEKITGTLDLYKITEKSGATGILRSWTEWRGTGGFSGFTWDGSFLAQGTGRACTPQPLCLGRSGPGTEATMSELMVDENFVSAAAAAWLLSQGHLFRWEIHEHGFWAKRGGGGYQIGHWREADRDYPRSIIHLGATPRGYNIFFHTHPFRDSHGFFSPADIGFASRRGILLIAYSAGGYHALDMRGN